MSKFKICTVLELTEREIKRMQSLFGEYTDFKKKKLEDNKVKHNFQYIVSYDQKIPLEKFKGEMVAMYRILKSDVEYIDDKPETLENINTVL